MAGPVVTWLHRCIKRLTPPPDLIEQQTEDMAELERRINWIREEFERQHKDERQRHGH